VSPLSNPFHGGYPHAERGRLPNVIRAREIRNKEERQQQDDSGRDDEEERVDPELYVLLQQAAGNSEAPRQWEWHLLGWQHGGNPVATLPRVLVWRPFNLEDAYRGYFAYRRWTALVSTGVVTSITFLYRMAAWYQGGSGGSIPGTTALGLYSAVTGSLFFAVHSQYMTMTGMRSVLYWVIHLAVFAGLWVMLVTRSLDGGITDALALGKDETSREEHANTRFNIIGIPLVAQVLLPVDWWLVVLGNWMYLAHYKPRMGDTLVETLFQALAAMMVFLSLEHCEPSPVTLLTHCISASCACHTVLLHPAHALMHHMLMLSVPALMQD